MDHWVLPYDIPRFILGNNGYQLVGKFALALCDYLGCEKLDTRAHSQQINGLTERYNQTIATSLGHYVAEHQADWNKFVQPVTYAYNNQVHRYTEVRTFRITLMLPPPDPTMLSPPTSFPIDSGSNLAVGKFQQ